jgi:hypothetical protein
MKKPGICRAFSFWLPHYVPLQREGIPGVISAHGPEDDSGKAPRVFVLQQEKARACRAFLVLRERMDQPERRWNR